MKRLTASLDSAQIGVAHSILQAAGIPCELRNDIISQAIPSLPFAPELWVRDEDYEEAARLIAIPPDEYSHHPRDSLHVADQSTLINSG